MTDESLEDLRARTDRGDRLDEADREEAHQDLVKDLVEALAEIENGDNPKTVSVWDGSMAALVAVLEEREALREELAKELAEDLGIDNPDSDRSAVLRMILRVGVRQADPELMEALEDAVRERAARTL